jgi:hypothetical protein
MRRYIIPAVLILFGLSSCLTIVQSLVTPGNIFTDNRIEGQWTDSDSRSILVQRFMKSKAKNLFAEMDHYTAEDSVFYTKFYAIAYREKNLDYLWFAGMVKIKDQLYLNLVPEECLDNNGKEAYKLGKETSTIAKLEWKDSISLILHFLDGDFIKKIILNGNSRIKHEYDPLFGTFVITASSDELEQFLEKYGNNESLFKGGNTIILTRKI